VSEQNNNAPRVDEVTPPPADAAQVDALRQRAENAERELVLRRALNGIDWFDGDDAFRELAQHASRDGQGNWQVALPPQNKHEEARRITPAEAARELAARKPHWVKARVIGGTGAGSGQGGATASAGVTYGELLRPENRAKLQEYIHERQDELERLRQSYFRS